MCSCIKQCCERSFRRQDITHYYTQSIHESVIKIFNNQNNNYHNGILKTGAMKIADESTSEYKETIFNSLLSEQSNTTGTTLKSDLTDYHQSTPATTRANNDISKTYNYNNNRLSLSNTKYNYNFLHSLLSIPSFENIYYLPSSKSKAASNQNNNYQQIHQQNTVKLPLTLFQLFIYGITHSEGYQIFIISGYSIFKYGGSSTIISFIICSISIIITSLCLSEFTSRVPMLQKNDLYKYIYVTNGELCAYLIGANNIINGVIITIISCIVFSGYFNSFLQSIYILNDSNIKNDPSLQYLFGDHDKINKYINIHIIPSLFLLFIIGIFFKILKVNTLKKQLYKYLFSFFTKFVIILFILIAGLLVLIEYKQNIPNILTSPCTYPTCSDPDTTESDCKCPSSAANSFFPFGIVGLFGASAINLLCFNGIFSLSKLTNYTFSAQKNISHSIVGVTITNCIIYSLIVFLLLSLIPFHSINILSTYSSVFVSGTISLPYFEGIISFFIVIIIVYHVLIHFSLTPFIIYQLSNDGLLFKYFSKMRDNYNRNGKGEIPLRAIVLYSIICFIGSLIFDIEILIEIGAISNLITHTLICGSILILRYSYYVHKKYLQKLKDKKKQNEQSFNNKRKKLKARYKQQQQQQQQRRYNNNGMDIETDVFMDDCDIDIETDNNYYDIIDYQIMQLKIKSEKSKLWNHNSLLLLLWLYILINITICILIFYYDEITSTAINVWSFVTVFLGLCLCFIFGVFIYIHETQNWRLWISPFKQQNQNENQIFMVPLMPFIALIGIALNSGMITSINYISSIILLIIYGICILLYYSYGIFFSKLHATKKSLLLDNSHQRYRFRITSISSIVDGSKQTEND